MKILKNKTVLTSVVFAIAQTLFCIIACVCKITVLVSVIVALVLLAVYIGVIAYLNRDKRNFEQPIKPDVTLTFKTISNLLFELCDLCKDKTIKEELRCVAEDFNFSDPVSNFEMHDTEDEIIRLASQIKTELLNDNFEFVKEILPKLRVEINNRNRLCKGNKK